MVRFLIEKYYVLLIIMLGIFIWNGLIRDFLLGLIFDISKERSVTDAHAYSRYNFYRNFFVYLGYLSYSLCFITSVLMLFVDKEGGLNRVIVILAITVSALMCLLMVLHFFNKTPFL